MNLTEIAKQILNEDTWGNNPSAAGGMSPGRAPTATTPPPANSGNMQDIDQSFRIFKNNIEQQQKALIKKFVNELKNKFLKKTVAVEASKGGIKQPNAKEYSITVSDIDVRQMDEKYYIVFVGTEAGKKDTHEYYLEDSQVQVNPAKSQTSAPAQSGLKSVGGMVPLQPTSNMAPTAKNIVPQG